MDQHSSIRSQKFALICTWIFCALTLIGWIGIAHFYSPAPADLALEETKTWFSETYRWRTIIGCTLFYIAAGFLVPSSIQFGFMLAKIEGPRPVWSVSTAVCGLFISLIIFFNCCAWIVASYRTETGADVIQAVYDWAWFAFLLGWIYLAIEMFASAYIELQDKSETPMIPHWFSWLTIFGGASVLGAAGPAFFKSGAFSYHGLLGFYIPAIVWGLYLAITSWFMYQSLNRQEAQLKKQTASQDSSANTATLN